MLLYAYTLSTQTYKEAFAIATKNRHMDSHIPQILDMNNVQNIQRLSWVRWNGTVHIRSGSIAG